MTYEKPEIPETPYSRHVPAEPTEPTRGEQLAERARTMWKNRPSLLELHYAIAARALIYSGFIAAGVGMTDDALDLHIADKMAQVEVNEDHILPLQELEWFVSEVGQMAQDMQD